MAAKAVQRDGDAAGVARRAEGGGGEAGLAGARGAVAARGRLSRAQRPLSACARTRSSSSSAACRSQAQIDVLVDELAGRAAGRHLSVARGARAASSARRAQSACAMTDPKRTADDRFARFKEHLRSQRLKSTAQRDTIVKAFLEQPAPHQRRGAVQRRAAPQPAHRLRHRLPHDEAAHRVRGRRRAPLPRRRGALRERREEASRPSDLRVAAARSSSSRSRASRACRRTTAKRLGFQFTGHKMELYGVCRDCRRARQMAG